MQSILILIKNLEEIFWRGDTVWNILVHLGSFWWAAEGAFHRAPILTDQENICWLFLKPNLPALCLNTDSPFLIQAIIFSFEFRNIWT